MNNHELTVVFLAIIAGLPAIIAAISSLREQDQESREAGSC